MYRLGKKAARPDSIKMKFGTYFDRKALPTPPTVFGHESIGVPWKMFANDKWSDCVFAGAAHETMVWTHEGGKTALFDDKGVLADYSAVTGFNPDDPNSDSGTDMQEAASYRRRIGILDAAGNRHKIDSYVSITPGHPDDLALATYLTGACGVGLRFPDSAMDQFDAHKRWTVVSGAKADGGHYVPCIGRNSAGDFLIVTWGRFQAMSKEFYDKFCDEAVAYISVETMAQATQKTPEGFDLASLRNDLHQLAG